MEGHHGTNAPDMSAEQLFELRSGGEGVGKGIHQAVRAEGAQLRVGVALCGVGCICFVLEMEEEGLWCVMHEGRWK